MQEKIKQVFANRDEIPLFYVESGSRLWNMASPDSDYDVRGFHLQSKANYYDFTAHRPLIEIMQGEFDFVSYDIDKMFQLLAKSNPTVFEWIRSNIIYFNQLPNWQETQAEIIQNFDFKALFHHYISLASNSLQLMKSERAFTYKKTFYSLRALLSADLASQKVLPELDIEDLFAQVEANKPNAISEQILQIAKQSLAKKKLALEKEKVNDEEKPLIITATNKYIEKLNQQIPQSSNLQSQLQKVLREYSYNVKSSYY